MPKITITATNRLRLSNYSEHQEWISLQEFSARMAWNDRTTRRRISDGTIEAKRFGPRLIRIHVSELAKFGETLGAFGGE
jgi:excisionase family DNA binding protein